MKPSELVDEARGELFKGWTQGSYRQAANVCAVAAVERVTMRHLQEDSIPTAVKAKKALLEKAREITSQDPAFPLGPVESIQAYNDADFITKDDILNLFDKVSLGLAEVGE